MLRNHRRFERCTCTDTHRPPGCSSAGAALNFPSPWIATLLYILEIASPPPSSSRSFFHTKYGGLSAPSASLAEAAESLFRCSILVIERAGSQGVEGRPRDGAPAGASTCLANVMGKSRPTPCSASSKTSKSRIDVRRLRVKYHLVFSKRSQDGVGDNMHLSLAFQSRHLEAVESGGPSGAYAPSTPPAAKQHQRVPVCWCTARPPRPDNDWSPDVTSATCTLSLGRHGALLVNNQIGLNHPARCRAAPPITAAATSPI